MHLLIWKSLIFHGKESLTRFILLRKSLEVTIDSFIFPRNSLQSMIGFSSPFYCCLYRDANDILPRAWIWRCDLQCKKEYSWSNWTPGKNRISSLQYSEREPKRQSYTKTAAEGEVASKTSR